MQQGSAQERLSTSFMSPAFSSKSAFAVFDSLLLPKHDQLSISHATEWHDAVGESDTEHFVADGGFALDRIGESWSFADLNNCAIPSTSESSNLAESSTGAKPESAYVSVSSMFS